jgi:diaminopropionate ammonia-lyase
VTLSGFELNRLADRSRPYPPAGQAIFGGARFDEAWNTIRAWQGYAPTPLLELRALAATAGVARLLYKDEGGRFGLGSFKALGGAYAVAKLAGEVRDPASLTVASATDGNHGRAVAWGAQRAGCQCVIYVHAGVSAGRVAAIERYGARVVRVDGNYDDSVREAARVAEASGWIVVSDTSYAGYSEIPRMVMQGYAVLVEEALVQGAKPTHVFVQGGVGGLAAAVAAHFWERQGSARPTIVVVEPARADCLLRSARAGEPRSVHGELDTIMAGLACGEPSLLAWEILSQAADAFISIPDEAAMAAMRQLASPHPPDPPVVGGESGVAGLAGLLAAAANADVRGRLGLGGDARVLVIGTEGDTDPAIYEKGGARGGPHVMNPGRAGA